MARDHAAGRDRSSAPWLHALVRALGGGVTYASGLRGGIALIAVIALALLAGPAVAVFPGASGEVAYRKPLDRDAGVYAIFGSASGQLTFPGDNESDRDVAWAPDGKRIAFTRSNPDQVRDHTLEIVNLEPYDSRELIAATAFNLPGAPPNARIYQPTWSPDGVWIAFVVQYYGSSSPDPYSGLWKIRAADGTGLQQLANVKHFNPHSDPSDNTAANPEWSPDGLSIVYDCASSRFVVVGFPWLFIHDLCVYDVASGGVRQINVDWPGRSGRLAAGGPRWTPDGKAILFTLMGTAPPVNGRSTTYSDVFTIRPDGTSLTRLTRSESTCARDNFGIAIPAFSYRSAVPSPDGEAVLVMFSKTVPTGLAPGYTDGRCTWDGTDELSHFPMRGGAPSKIGEDPDWAAYDVDLDWQSIPSGLIVHVDDGHGNPLRGLKVELFDTTAAHAPIPGAFRNEMGGSYAFDALLVSGDYVVRATLVDHDFRAPFQPAFDVRSFPVLPAPEPTNPDVASAPIWLEERITVSGGTTGTREALSFDGADLLASNASVADIEAGRLDDLAHLYFRIRQFVDWVHAELYLSDTIQTVSFWAFATTDYSLPPDECCAIRPSEAYYDPSTRAIAMGTELSKYESRDGVSNGPGESDDAPENGEWHEFTHHLYMATVATGLCLDESARPQTNHGGYSNRDTCDSMQEGFATFLPAWASRSIEGATDSAYGRLWDLEWHSKAWSIRVSRSSGKRYSLEDFAVAALFWDLVDVESDAEPTVLLGSDGAARFVSYLDGVSIPLATLWNQIRGFTGAGDTVDQLRLSFGGATPTIDLDGNETLDVRDFDVPFLMHGFFPIDDDQQLQVGPETPRYWVGSAIGRSDHHEYDPSGLAILRTLSPRRRTPSIEGANLGIAVRDASGRPISGATIELSTQFPDMSLPRVSIHPLAGAAGSVHLELPTYFDHFLPEGAPLPPCEPENDVEIEVTLVARRNGYTSTDSHTLGNCTYQQAIAAAVGDDALSYTLTFPEDGATPVTIAAVAGAPVAVNNVTTGTFEVTLACDDPVVADFASGCIRTEYRIDGGPIRTYARPLRVPPPVQRFEYRSVDAAGNEESFREASFDSDADGISDSVELQQGTNPLAADTDADGALDAADNCPAIANPDQQNSDTDPQGDACDDDDDGDGLSDASEIAGGTDPRNPDTDGDALRDPDELALGTNPLDADSDDDALADGAEITSGANPLDSDSDDDGLLDGAEVDLGTSPVDVDSDDDGDRDAVDNCPLLANPAQEDLDGDGVGDVCDPSPGSRWKLIGVTDDSRFTNVKETLYELDTSNASATFVMTLGNGDIGEAIAFSPADGLLYHASGTLSEEKVWEAIDLTTRTIRTSGPLTTPSGSQVGAMTYNSATGRFLLADTSGDFFDTTLTGSATSIGFINRPKGLAFVGDALYAASRVDEALYRVDPHTGAWVSEVYVNLAGVSIRGLNGLATHPDTGELWVIINQPGDTQYLATVDPATGLATAVGTLPDGFAGIAFVPEPSSLLSLSTGVLAMAFCATLRRRRLRHGASGVVLRRSMPPDVASIRSRHLPDRTTVQRPRPHVAIARTPMIFITVVPGSGTASKRA